MFKTNIVSYRSKVIVQIALIFILVMLMAWLGALFSAKRHAEVGAKKALENIESHFDAVIDELSPLLLPSEQRVYCSNVLTELRQHVFRSDTLKEIGLFDDRGNVYCNSNRGVVSFYLYQTILDRLQLDNVTLSYTKTKLSQQKSVVLLFTGASGNGISVVIPPRYILRIVESTLNQPSLNYNVSIISRHLVEENQQKWLQSYRFRSERYPLEVVANTSLDYYIHYFLSLAWIGIVVASVLSVILLYRRQDKFTQNSLEASLQEAIKNDYFDIHYQPITNVLDQQTIGCEALLRWNDPVQGTIAPNIFIPLAEKVGLIEQLSNLVIAKTCSFIDKNHALFSDKYISVNISRSVILKHSFMQKLLAFLEQVPHLTPHLVFEITEDNNFSTQELVVLKQHLDAISSHGIKIAVDDFGTGYSGLDFIRQYPFQFVKIDRVFIKSLYDDSNVIPLLESMLIIANNLNMKVIVEGVEEQYQLQILQRIGFTYIQGFYFAKPLPDAELLSYLSEKPQGNEF